VYARDTGEEISECSIHVDGKILHPGETIKLSTVVLGGI
jgi:hypothetical protein